MKIAYMGTPEFAVPSLQAIIDAGHEVVAVFTQPDKPKGRGYQLTPPPVKELAEKYNIPVYQPTKMRDGTVLNILKEKEPQLIAVVAYGRILPKDILDFPKYGCINVHGSILPKYRGAGPIQWSVINGEPIVGITTMYMGEGLDTGDMLLKAETPLGEDETSGELHDRLSLIGAELLIETISLIEKGEVTPIPQKEDEATHAPMLNKEMAVLNFDKTPQEIHNLVRGLNPWPVAYTKLDGKLLKVYKTRIADGFRGKNGMLLDEKAFIVGCANGAIEFLEVQGEGGKRISGKDFLMGKRLEKGKILSIEE